MARQLTELPPGHVFVFGSNLAGRHGKGAAWDAVRFFGAVRGRGIGMQGQSYAIPTKDEHLAPLSLDAIRKHVAVFLAFARSNPHLYFEVTAIGCGLAGYAPGDIAPMFENPPRNVQLPLEFYPVKAAS
mgnify:CR=1 FL=1